MKASSKADLAARHEATTVHIAHVKEILRSNVALAASGVEIFISIIVLIAICIVGVRVVLEVFTLARVGDFYTGFNNFLAHAFNLIIGVEFIKMLAKHTPGSAIEVLLFAIARQMVVEHTSPFENLIGIVTIALIFAIRKFLFVPSFGEHLPNHPENPDDTVFLERADDTAAQED